jgi:hypothetical protein
MQVIGIDFGSGPDVSVLTYPRGHFLREGDMIRLAGTPNRFRHYVATVLTATSVELGLHIRPSKGYRRHVRRKKQLRGHH